MGSVREPVHSGQVTAAWSGVDLAISRPASAAVAGRAGPQVQVDPAALELEFVARQIYRLLERTATTEPGRRVDRALRQESTGGGSGGQGSGP